ncbi:MAG: hypothetical protein ABIH92_03230 [Nanoarchaeota archaeon]
MVLCWLALPVFAILAIFSARYRRLTVESLECLFKTATFQKCKSGLDDRIKSQITGKLLKFSPATARLFYKHYKVISLILLIVFIWSTYMSAATIYNYVNYGNCNGEDSDDFCIIDVVDGDDEVYSCEHGALVEGVELQEDTYEPCPCGAEG